MSPLDERFLADIDASIEKSKGASSPAPSPSRPTPTSNGFAQLPPDVQVAILRSESGLDESAELTFDEFKAQYSGIDLGKVWESGKAELGLYGATIKRFFQGKLGTNEREGALLEMANDYNLIAAGAYDFVTKGKEEAFYNVYKRMLKFQRQQFDLAAENVLRDGAQGGQSVTEAIQQMQQDFSGFSFFTDPSFVVGFAGKGVAAGAKGVGKLVGKTAVGSAVAGAVRTTNELIPTGVRSATKAVASFATHPASHTIEQFGRIIDKTGKTVTALADAVESGGKIVRNAEIASAVGLLAWDYFNDGDLDLGPGLAALAIGSGSSRPVLQAARRSVRPGHTLRSGGTFLELSGRAARMADGRVGAARLLTAAVDNPATARAILHGSKRIPFGLTVKAAALGDEVLQGAMIDGFAGFLAGGGDMQVALEEAFVGSVLGPSGRALSELGGAAIRRAAGGRRLPLGMFGALETTEAARRANDQFLADWRATRDPDELRALDGIFDRALADGADVTAVEARRRETMLAAAELDTFLRGFQLTSDGIGDGAIQFATADEYADALLVTEFGEGLNQWFDDRAKGEVNNTYELPTGNRLQTFTYSDLTKMHADRRTRTRGVEVVTTDENGALKPRVMVNVELDRAAGKTGLDSLGAVPYTLAHEVFHAVEDLRAPEDIENDPLLEVQARMRSVLFGENGVFSEADVADLYDTYQTALGTTKRYAGLDQNGKDAAKALVAREVGAEAFANFYLKTTRSGDQGLLGIADRIAAKNRNADWDDVGGLYGIDFLGRVAKGARALGVPVDGFGSVNSQVFGFQNTPVLDALMAEYVTAKEQLVQRLSAQDTDQAKPAYEVSTSRITSPAFVQDNEHIFSREPDGSIRRDKQGRPILARKKEREAAEKKVAETIHGVLARTPLAAGEIGLTPNYDRDQNVVGFSGAHLSDAQLIAIEQSPAIPDSIKAKLRKMNEALKDGDTIVIDYYAAIRPGTTRQYSPRISVARRVLTPMSLEASRAGNFFVNTFDVFQFEAALNREFKRGGKSKFLAEWNGDVNAMLVDMQKYLNNHRQRLPGASNGLGEHKRDLLNGFLGMQSNQHPLVNPNPFKQARMGQGSFVRRRRIDRIADMWSERNGLRLPVNWSLQSQNFLPAGANLDAGVRRRIDQNPDLTPREAATENADPRTAQSARDFVRQYRGQFQLEDVDEETVPVINTEEARQRGVLFANLPSEGVVNKVRETLHFTFGYDLLQEYYNDLATGNLKAEYGGAFRPEELEGMLRQPEGAVISDEARKAYEQLAQEIEVQYKWMRERDGIEVRYSQDDPYADSIEMIADVRDNKRMRVFSGGGNHPFTGDSTKDIDGVTINEKFRAIHDYFGHASEGSGFGPVGEERAWYKHSRMFSPLAREAMSAETRGQNSWVNFGPHMWDESGWRGSKDHPRYLPPEKRPFALQKVAVAGPALSSLSEVATFNEDQNFQPAVPIEPIRIPPESPAGQEMLRLRVSGATEGGVSFDLDGNLASPENVAAVTLASFNVPRNMVRPELVSYILSGWREALDEPGMLTGTFILGKPKEGQVSIDLNVTIPRSPEAIEYVKRIAAANGQQAAFSFDESGNYIEHKVTGSGDAVLRHPLAIRLAAQLTAANQEFNPGDVEAFINAQIAEVLLNRPRRAEQDFPRAGRRTGRTTLHHWAKKDYRVLEPQRFGTGIPGEEKNELQHGRMIVAPVRTYWGTNAYKRRGPEPGLGPEVTTISVPNDRIFRLDEDELPARVRQTAGEIARAFGYDSYGGHADPTRLALAMHGYLGVTEGGYSDVVMTFWPLDTRTKEWIDFAPRNLQQVLPDDSMAKFLNRQRPQKTVAEIGFDPNSLQEEIEANLAPGEDPTVDNTVAPTRPDLTTLDPGVETEGGFEAQAIQRLLADVDFTDNPLTDPQDTPEGQRAQQLLQRFPEEQVLREVYNADERPFTFQPELNDIDVLEQDPSFPGNFQPAVPVGDNPRASDLNAEYQQLAKARLTGTPQERAAVARRATELVEQAAFAAGYTQEAFHGTTSGGFSRFDPERSRKSNVIFFSDSPSHAASYTPINDEILPGDPEKVLEDRGTDEFDGIEIIEVEDEDLKGYELWVGGYHGGVFLEDERGELLAAIAEGMQEASSQSGVYRVMLDTRGFVEVDWEDRNWDEEANGFLDVDDFARYLEDIDAPGGIVRNIYDQGPFAGSGDGDEFLVRDPTRIKRPAPFTFDKNGELIPLDQRFNPSTADINFQPAVPVEQVQRTGPYKVQRIQYETEEGAIKSKAGGIPAFIDERGALATVSPGLTASVESPFVDYNTYRQRLAREHAGVLRRTLFGLSPETVNSNVSGAWVDRAVDDIADNYFALYELAAEVYGPEIRQRMAQWYYGARRIAESHAARFGVSVQQAAASLAAHSPQRHWFTNVALAERTAEMLIERPDYFVSADYANRLREWNPKRTGATAKAIAAMARLIDLVEGTPIGELQGLAQAAAVRFGSEEIHGRKSPVVTPEGDVFEGGGPTMVWGNTGFIAASISALLSKDPAVLSAALGGEHKVRNFYNNILLPGDPRFVTSDTHNVAAGLWLPVGGSDLRVKHNFGGNPTDVVDLKTFNTKPIGKYDRLAPLQASDVGLGGTYALYHEAINRAAARAGIVPHEMQSITWEMIRLLIPDNMRGSKNKKAQAIWQIQMDAKAKGLSQDETRKRIIEATGGIERLPLPEWAQR